MRRLLENGRREKGNDTLDFKRARIWYQVAEKTEKIISYYFTFFRAKSWYITYSRHTYPHKTLNKNWRNSSAERLNQIQRSSETTSR